MNKIIQKFSHPALFGFLIAGAVLIGLSMFGSGPLVVSPAHAWFCNGNTSSSPCGTITTIVNVVNTGGGTANPSNFTVSLYGSLDPATTTFKGSASGTVEKIDPENYQVTVSPKTNYVYTYSSDCSGTLNAGDSKTCTVTATYCPPTVTPPSADISISKTADVTSTFGGDTVHYTIAVTDNGPATSTGVTATDTLPSGMTFVSASATQGSYSSSTGSWNVGTLSNGQSATLTIAAIANTVTASTTVTNTATVAESASETDTNTANDSSSVSICVEPCPPTTPTSTPSSTPIADLSINKTVDNATPSAGATINYTLTVDALGPATSTGVTASDTLPSGLTFENATASVGSYATSTGIWTIGDMSASSTATLNIAALVNASDTANQAITNFATVGETPSSTNQTGNSSSSVTVTVQGNGGCTVNCGGNGNGSDAALSIAKTANVTSTLPGDVIDYTITATAGGPQPSTGVVATDTLPSGLTFENATASVGTYSSSTGTWTVGTLAPNATATLQIAALVNVTGTAGTTITNTATIGESTTLTNTSNNTTAQVSIPVGTNGGGGSSDVADLAINKTVDNASPVSGSDVNFTVVVTNNGPDTAADVVAMDPLPIGLATVSATTTASTTFNMANGVWTIGTLASGATTTLSVEAEVSAAAGMQIVNTATVSSTLGSLFDPNPANNSSSVTLNVQSNGGGCTSNCGGGGGNTPSAQIGIVKTVDNSDPATGSVIHYTLTVSASGPDESFGVVASDTLPSGITFDSASSSQGSYASSTGIWTIGDMADGQSQTLVITATVTAPNGTTITNTGTVHESPIVISPLSGPMTSSVTITVGGSGGGGGGSGGGGGGGNGGGGGGGGTGTNPGQVLGASCGLYLTSYIHPIRQDLNDPTEVKKLQVFLNQNLGLNLTVNGVYDAATIAAVNQFQVKYHSEVLQPWVPLGLPTQFTPTSYVYQSTERWINLIMCPPLNIPLPALKVDTGE